ncbi:putative StAR-related lipid transfer protein 7, mitochondrial [Cocos nucifera]|uniref:Putative StAR-related lipid transfer protein 7, mitochondrial n=1 Tax=Cocos nucifera TaxID=13894 RepID=A0A8K0IC95_COCNU|nr:putative StAR-related lipid transfer protein 7, mitochondrial [Cocos nucifera]
MIYQAWRHEPEVGPIIFRSRTVFEDATPELVRDFFWDDDFRLKWDPMLVYFKTLEEFPQSGTTIVHWIKKFPFFCSDREYIIGRRIWESGRTYYCVTKGVPYPALCKNEKPRRVELYFSSWRIRAVESRRQDAQLSACEVTLIHYEDMGIPKDVAKLGVRHGMWGAVKKLQSGMRAYQVMRKTDITLSRSALVACITTKIPVDGTIGLLDPEPEPSNASEAGNNDDAHEVHQGIDWKWVVIGGTVAVVCGLQTGLIGKALLFGAARRLARK